MKKVVKSKQVEETKKEEKIEQQSKAPIYFFAYAGEQDEPFYSKMFSPDVKKHPARLNGFAKCKDQSHFLLLKKDPLKSVDGVVFEITKDQLFALDRWNLYPQYGRFAANVILTDTNEIIDNALIYTKLEEGKWEPLSNEEADIYRNPNFDEKNVNGFFALEETLKNYNIHDFALLYKIDKEKFDYINQFTHPFLNFEISIKEEPNALLLNFGVLMAIQENDEYFAIVQVFGKKEPIEIFHYYQMFYDKIPNFHHSIKFFPTVMDININFLNETKPDYFISYKEDKNLDLTSNKNLAIWEKAMELVTNDFNINPWTRFDIILKAFFDYRKQNKI